MPSSALTTVRTSLVVTLLSVASCAIAQPSINLFGHAVPIGMERQAALTRLKAFRLVCLGEQPPPIDKCDSLLVQSATEPYETYGNVFHKQGRVKSVRKYWTIGYEGKDPQAFARTLFAVVSQLQYETGIGPTVTTSERRDPGVVQQSIFITAGRKSVEVSYIEGLRGADGTQIAPFVNLTEIAE